MAVQGLTGDFYLSIGTYRAVYHKPLHVSSQRGIEIFVFGMKCNFINV